MTEIDTKFVRITEYSFFIFYTNILKCLKQVFFPTTKRFGSDFVFESLENALRKRNGIKVQVIKLGEQLKITF